MRRWTLLAVIALLLGGCSALDLGDARCPPSRKLVSAVADYVDFVQVGGITYVAGMRPAVGRALREGDLGAQVAEVRCTLADHRVEDPSEGHLDGDAAYLAKGTALHAVKGYRPSFRLAARRDDRLVLYEAEERPGARSWADLLDLRDKVRRIGVNDDDNRPVAAIEERAQVARLVDLLLATPYGRPTACADRGRVFLAFHLEDGTGTSLSYNLGDRRLDCRNPLPVAFGAAVRAAMA